MQVPGGVGLVFRHDGDSACLHIDRIVPNGPADIGVLSAGDRLVAIDRIKINSSLEGEAPQLPGPHGTPVTLTFQRPANGPVFYDGCETHEFDMHLTRHRDFFPDTLAQQPDWPRPQGTFSDNDSSLWEHDVSCADSLPQSESADQNSKLVDEILKSISIPQVQGSGWGNEENVVPLPTVEDPWRHHGQRSQYGSLTSVERNTNTLALQQEVDGVKAQIMLLEDQIVREQDEMKRMKESSEQRIRALVDAQNADVAQISNLMATIDRQTAELQAARQGEIEPERLRTEWDLLQRERDRATVLSEENDAIWKSLELEITRAHSERDGLREKLREAQVELEKLTLQSQHEQEQDAKDPEKIALKKVLARAELTRKKTESLAQEIVRLRSEIRKAGGGGDKMPILEEELERLRDENRVLKGDQQSMQARKIGLEANDLSTFQSRSPQVTGQFRKSLSPALPQAQITSAGYLQKHQSPSHVKSTPPHLLNKSQTLSAQTKTPSETPASIPLPTTVTPHQVRLFSKLKAQPLPSLTNLGPQQMHRASCKVDIELNIPFSEVEQDNEAFIIQMRMNLADALESDIRYITVLQLKQEATSIIATVQLNPSNSADESAPSQKAMALAQQAVDPKSPLRNGLLTSFVVRVKNIQAVQGYVDSPLALIQVRVGSCRNIPVQDGLYESFVVIQVNENDFGITEKCEGEDPIFDQQFEGQVRVEQNAMISLCLHQQNVNGRDSLLGYVAVPLKRVMESRGENGWYDLRSPDSDLLVQGETGVAEVHLSFTVSVVAGTVPQQAETKEGFLIKRPVGMLDVLIGRARHLLHGIGRLVSCSLSVGSSNRKTRVVEARANAEWDEGFQLPIHAPDTDTLSIQLKDHVSSDDHTQDVLGMCSISVSQILRKMVQIGNGGESKPVSGWYALQTTDGGGNGTIQLLLSMHYRSTPESIPEPVVGWLRDYGCETGERESLQLFFVLDPFSQLLSGFSSEQAVQKLVPTVQYEVRGCTISGVSSQQESTQEIRFDLERHPRTKLQLAAPSKKEWEKWFDVLYRTGRILTLTNVFRDDIALSQDLQPSPDKDGRSNTSCDSIPDTATDGRHSHSSASPQTVIAHPHSLSLALPPTVTAIHRAPDSVSPPSLPATTASESEGRLLEIDKPDFLIELHLLKARNMPTTEERRDEQRTEARPLETYASVQFGSTTHSSQVSRSTSDPVWNESMRLTYSAGDKGLITIVFWGLPVSGGGGGERLSEDIDRQFDGKQYIGHIGVPPARVVEAGREEGWYDLRDKDGSILVSSGGQTAVLVSLSIRRTGATLPSHVQGSIVSGSLDSEDVFAKHFHVLNPYTQQLLIYVQRPTHESEGILHRTCNIRGCSAEGSDAASQALDGVKDKDPTGRLLEECFPFIVKTTEGRMLCCADDAASRDVWVQALLNVGNPPDQTMLDASHRTTFSSSSAVSKIRVIVERARNLEPENSGESSMRLETLGYFCLVSVREAQDRTRAVEHTESPTWNQTFEMDVHHPDNTLVLVQLFRSTLGGEEEVVGHVAVPIVRVRGTQREQGWYEVRRRDGSLVMGSKGKASLLLRFSYVS